MKPQFDLADFLAKPAPAGSSRSNRSRKGGTFRYRQQSSETTEPAAAPPSKASQDDSDSE